MGHASDHDNGVENQAADVEVAVKDMKERGHGKDEKQQAAADGLRPRKKKQERGDDFDSAKRGPYPMRKGGFREVVNRGRRKYEQQGFPQDDEAQGPTQYGNGDLLGTLTHFVCPSFF